MKEKVDTIVIGARQLLTCAAPHGALRGEQMQQVGLIENGALAIQDGRIIAVGEQNEILQRYQADQQLDCRGKVIIPALVDPHTHVVYAGDRIAEFELRIKGASYMEIMQAGGGILSTMRATRSATIQQLVDETTVRLNQMLRVGTATAEVKTGYGLDTETELKLLQAIELLDKRHPITLIPTFLPAHAVPPEYEGRADEYIQLIIDDMLPQAWAWYQQSHFAAQNIPFFIDVFCEEGVFTLEQSHRVLDAGKRLGMQVKAHVDEFVHLGGVPMALSLGAVSVDHLDATPPEDITTLAQSNAVAIVIPTVNFNLGSTHFADARAIIDSGAALALTTDINPGSAPCPSMPMAMAIACRYQKLLPSEALIASTINAAYAIGLADKVGSLEVGKWADFLIIDTTDYRHLAYQFGVNLVEAVFKRGQQVI